MRLQRMHAFATLLIDYFDVRDSKMAAVDNCKRRILHTTNYM